MSGLNLLCIEHPPDVAASSCRIAGPFHLNWIFYEYGRPKEALDHDHWASDRVIRPLSLSC
jgi:hypothetical protein